VVELVWPLVRPGIPRRSSRAEDYDFQEGNIFLLSVRLLEHVVLTLSLFNQRIFIDYIATKDEETVALFLARL
jgi:hypothetical protein